MSVGSNFALLDTKRGKPNKIARSAEQEITDQPHIYDGTLINNKVVGYVPKPWDPAANVYPKMLYHPNYGKKPKPEAERFSLGARTMEQIQAAADAYQDALNKWNRENRTFLALSDADEERLIKKGWTITPPAIKKQQAFDLASEEI